MAGKSHPDCNLLAPHSCLLYLAGRFCVLPEGQRLRRHCVKGILPVKLSVSALLCLILLGLLAGCGGNGGSVVGSSTSNGTGRAALTIAWPTRTRLIPSAANSIAVVIQQGTTTAATQIVTRPAAGGTSTVNFPVLPTGALSVTATAYPNADATRAAQAAASLPLLVTANQTTRFSLTMSSTIDHLDITAVSASVGVGATLAITATAKDAAGAVVLLTPAKLQRLSDNVASATVDASGIVTGVAIGSANIRVTDPESGKSGLVGVTVTKSVQTFVINGKIYRASDPQETVTAQFTPAEGGGHGLFLPGVCSAECLGRRHLLCQRLQRCILPLHQSVRG